ncbi:hypothetical protein IEN85_00220 [Pelagicoccus sp. NFK12]|uniref:Alpha-L-rhamnosidase six-hairpin glycosidase domain-containing protein n=1 Tax=Pelagicoccus enzymogenes TaxID=2773457 RepID=A0A927F3U6_9BACT|nr:hypothetical protein [Pelagicoccus enzymogenes]MBD5777917.1 hypothetical protein [Pelagicoccus enzymogenes]
MQNLTYTKTGKPEFDTLVPKIRAFLAKDTMDMLIDGEPIRGYRSPDTPAVWIRDHSDIMRGARFFEQDLTSAVTHFANTQARNGRIFDYFTVQPEKVPCEKENWTKYVRVPVEADVEYRFIKAAFLAWQATGDDLWMSSLIPSMEKALNYAFTHPWRWDPERQLVKRAYTIDSWDFAYTAGSHDWLQFQIDDNTFWGIMHGDNSGFYEACLLLAKMLKRDKQSEKAAHWTRFAQKLKKRMNEVCWNGTFYTHFVKQNPVKIEGVDEASQLSFSNPMNVNRGVASHEQAVSLLNEYLKRNADGNAFAEWYSITPAFPDGIFGEEKIVAGAYSNGGIMPLVGGELARAYLEHGFESQGVATLKKYHDLISKNNETYLWYFPDGTASSIETSSSPDATPTDGWGSSSMLHGFVEGLVGVQDQQSLWEDIVLSPRWHAAGVAEAEASVGYECSGAQFQYTYQESNDSISLSVASKNSRCKCHLMIPESAKVASVQSQGQSIEFEQSKVQQSNYLDFKLAVADGADIQIKFK